MKKFSLTHKLLAVALAFVLVAVSLPDYLSFAQQPAQEQSETDEFEDNLADGDPSDEDLSGDNPSDTGEQEMEQQVVLHLQAPETVPMGTAGSFGLSAQNTAAVAADVSIQLTQEEMAAYQVAEQDSTLALQPVGGSLTFTLQPGEQVEGTLSFLYPNGYSSREVVEIAEEDISIVLQQLPEEETGGTPIETIPPEGEIQPPEQGQTPPADETQQPGGEGPTEPSDEGEPTPPESGDGEEPTDPSDEEEPTPPESGDGEEPTDPSDGGKQLHQNPVMGRKQPTLRTERMKPFRQNPAMERKQPTLRMRKKQTCLMMKPTLPSGRGKLCPRMSRSRFSRL